MTQHPLSLFWFRQDLRLQDNPALSAALEAGKVIPLYILDDTNSGKWKMGGASRWWLHQALKALNISLDDTLRVVQGDPLKLIPKLVQETGATGVFWNRCYEPWRIKRDTQLKKNLTDTGVTVSTFNGSLLWEPWEVLKDDKTPYRVFTPFYRKGCLKKKSLSWPGENPLHLETKNGFVPRKQKEEFDLKGLSLLPPQNWYEKLSPHWKIGEKGAQKRLKDFLEDGLKGYKKGRNHPDHQRVSRLSAYLHWGHLSPRQVWVAATQKGEEAGWDQDLDSFLSELGWREFSYSLLYHFPTLPEENFQSKFDHFPWRKDPDNVACWQKGQTGIPLVDAGMRELWQTGYMHNRIRMVVASFLIKNLLQDWRTGEKWFWDCLVDADLANNSASWQWVAGSGADAAPYFRIFNPVTQGEKFDEHGHYTRHFVPELDQLPNKYLFCPWEAPESVLKEAGVTLGQNYPHPLVDLKGSRERALEALSETKKDAD